MEFFEKLDFLIDTTRTNNKELAQFCSTSPSTISFLRTGARKMPRQTQKIEKMAEFFSLHVNTTSQRIALADCIGITSLRREIAPSALQPILYQWLIGQELDMLSLIADKFSATYDNFDNTPNDPINIESSLSLNTAYYPGPTGKWDALERFFYIVQNAKEPGKIYYYSSESPEWYIGNTAIYNKLQSALLEALQKGFEIHHIMQSSVDEASFFEAINLWIPLYLRGNIHVYYYPRYSNLVHHRTLWLYPDNCAVASNSILDQKFSPFTVFTVDNFILESHLKEIQLLLASCQQAIKPIYDYEEISTLMQEMTLDSNPMVQKYTSLPMWNIPIDDAIDTLATSAGYSPNELEVLFNPLRLYQADMGNIDFPSQIIDICPIATADQVIQGFVPITLSMNSAERGLYYTPKLYAMHLQNILDNMERHDNYIFLPITYRPGDELSILLKENKKAIIARAADIDTLHVLMQPQLLIYLYEYLLKLAERGGMPRTRPLVKAKLLDLINRLQE